MKYEQFGTNLKKTLEVRFLAKNSANSENSKAKTS